MPDPTVIDTADIELWFPLKGAPFDFAGTTLRATLSPVRPVGGIAYLTEVESKPNGAGGLSWTADDDNRQYIVLRVPSGDPGVDAFRQHWNGQPISIVGDIKRTVDGSDAVELFGTISFILRAGSDSSVLTSGTLKAYDAILQQGRPRSVQLGSSIVLPGLQGPISLILTDAVAALATAVAGKASPQDIEDAISGLLGGAGPAYDTLRELQDLIVADETALSALATLVGGKVDKTGDGSDIKVTIAGVADTLANILGALRSSETVAGVSARLTGIDQRLNAGNFEQVSLSEASIYSAPPEGVTAALTAADGTALLAWYADGSPYVLDRGADKYVIAERLARIAADDRLMGQVADLAGAIKALVEPAANAGAATFSAQDIANENAAALVSAANIQNRSLGNRFIKPTYGYNARLSAGQSISAGVSSFGHHLMYSGPASGVLGVMMLGQSSRAASTTGSVWEGTGLAAKNDDNVLRPLKGSRRPNGNDADGSPPVSDAVNDASNYFNANIGEAPAVAQAYEFRRARNDRLGRPNTYAGEQTVNFDVGIGSTRIAWWLPGNTEFNYWNRYYTAAQAAKANADSLGLTSAVVVHDFLQGVSDTSTTSKDAYKTSLAQYEVGLRSLEQTVFNQSQPAPLLLYAEANSGPGFTPTQSAWNSTATYAQGAISTVAYDLYYSLIGDNLNNNPTTSPSAWLKMRLLGRPELVAGRTYAAGDWGWIVDTNVVRLSLANGNATDPAAGSNWVTLPGAWATTGLSVQQATLEYALGSNTAFLACPGYPIPDRGTHYGINGSQWIGAMLAKVESHIVNENRDWRPTHIVSAKVRGNKILLRYHAPCPPLVARPAYNRVTATWLKDLGLRVFDGQSPLALSEPPGTSSPSPLYDMSLGVKGLKVEIVADLVVMITAPRNFVGPVTITYADPCSYALGNISDSDPAVSAAVYQHIPCAAVDPAEAIPELVGKPFPLHNPAVPQIITAVAA